MATNIAGAVGSGEAPTREGQRGASTPSAARYRFERNGELELRAGSLNSKRRRSRRQGVLGSAAAPRALSVTLPGIGWRHRPPTRRIDPPLPPPSKARVPLLAEDTTAESSGEIELSLCRKVSEGNRSVVAGAGGPSDSSDASSPVTADGSENQREDRGSARRATQFGLPLPRLRKAVAKSPTRPKFSTPGNVSSQLWRGGRPIPIRRRR